MDKESSGVNFKSNPFKKIISKYKSIFTNEESDSKIPSFLKNKKVAYSLLGFVILICNFNIHFIKIR